MKRLKDRVGVDVGLCCRYGDVRGCKFGKKYGIGPVHGVRGNTYRAAESHDLEEIQEPLGGNRHRRRPCEINQTGGFFEDIERSLGR